MLAKASAKPGLSGLMRVVMATPSKLGF